MGADPPLPDPQEALSALYRDLRSGPGGLTAREAARRLVAYGPNELSRRAGPGWTRALADQLVHPLALLLWVAAALSVVAGSPGLAAAIVAVIVLNGAVALLQERQAERAVEALQAYLPARARVLRDGAPAAVLAHTLVPGDVILVEEGDRISADARLIDSGLEVDMSPLTGESVPVYRSADDVARAASPLEAHDLVLSGTSCTAGSARAVVVATGMATQIGRVAALAQRVERERSPLEEKVRRVAWLIAGVAAAAGLAFLAIGVTAAGLPVADAVEFAIGLLVANVPEGLLPTITLALAVGVRGLARRGALVKRLSAVETLGSTTVICTDKTGTLTQNRMRPAVVWAGGEELRAGDPASPAALLLGVRTAACTTAVPPDGTSEGAGDPTERALLEAAAALGADVQPDRRDARRRRLFPFDPVRRLMSTVEDDDDGARWVSAKGAPESVLPRCVAIVRRDGRATPLTPERAGEVVRSAEGYAADGLRVLAVAGRRLAAGERVPERREDAERDLVVLGLVAVADPPRRGVAEAVARCRRAGIRVIVVTGDNGLTAASIARQVGIAAERLTVVTGDELDAMSEAALERRLDDPTPLVFARCSPEAKLRIADALRAAGHVVAMTGDGVNDAPALRRADIGVAMGASGTDVAREAATMILVDDDFSTIVSAVEEGRRVYDNVRKFVLYIFAHAPPEVVPFLVFALSGGAVPLPLTVMQILAIDLGTETLPAVALGREPAEPGVMRRPPHSRHEGVVDRALLVRAWLVLGAVSAALVMGGFLAVLVAAGWSPGDPVGAGDPLHSAYTEATTMTFLGIVACQVGVAVAARSEREPLRRIGPWTNPMLLWGIAFELAFSAALVVVPGLSGAFGLAVPEPWALALLPAFAVIVWAADAGRRSLAARPQSTRSTTSPA